MLLTRRGFLGATAAGAVSLALPLGLGRSARAATSRDVLVVVFLRGGADGLNLVVPTGDPAYYQARPTIQVPPGQELPITSFFGLHPDLGELATLFQSGDLALLHAAGSTDDSRSHFDCQDFMERAAPGDKTVLDGWLNRYLAQAGGDDVLAGVTLGYAKEGSMAGTAQNLSLRSIDSFTLSGDGAEQRKAALSALHGANPGSLLDRRTAETLAAVDTIAGVSTETSVTYPDGRFARNLRDIAALIKADIGIHVAAVSRGGWDHHDNEVEDLSPRLRDLSASLAAFHADLGTNSGRVLTLVMTEFGRTPFENGSAGTDHGRGSVMMALGGGVQGGRVLLKNGAWPGIFPEEPYRDLDVTTDFRDVLAEVLDRHLGVSNLASILPSFSVSSGNYPGLFT